MTCARAALAGGATWLAVATAAEAGALRAELPDARLLVLGALTPEELEVTLEADADLAVWRPGFLELVRARAAALGSKARVHIKYDTGMGRLGERDPTAVRRAGRGGGRGRRGRADRFLDPLRDGRRARVGVLRAPARALHGRRRRPARPAPRPDRGTPQTAPRRCRSAASHFDMVRCGIAIYGLDPFGEDPFAEGLEPALELHSYVADVKRFEPGRQRRLRPHLAGARPRPASGCCRSATATASAGRSPTTPTCSSAAGASRWWAPSRWTT